MITTLLAMQQADAAFPSGAFAFSSGIEGVTLLPDAFDVTALQRHAAVTLRHRWAGLERVALVHTLVPHLQQAIRIERHLERSADLRRLCPDLLSTFQFGIVIVTASSAVTYANQMAEDILSRGDGLSVRYSRLQATHPDTAAKLACAVSRAAS